MNDLITLRFDSKTLDYIANVLGQRPFAEVQPVLVDISRQVAMHNAERDAPKTGAQSGNGQTDPLPPLVPMQ